MCQSARCHSGSAQGRAIHSAGSVSIAFIDCAWSFKTSLLRGPTTVDIRGAMPLPSIGKLGGLRRDSQFVLLNTATGTRSRARLGARNHTRDVSFG